VTPNILTGDSTQFDFPADRIDAIVPTSSPLGHPIATGMMPDSSKYYVANLLDSTITVIDMNTHAAIKHINLIANYNPVTGAISGPVGALPIQTPVAPNGRNMVTANTLTGTILVTNTHTDTVVAARLRSGMSWRPVRRQARWRVLRLRFQQVLEPAARRRSGSEWRRQSR
jgi:YVTN family beta-propeller protein